MTSECYESQARQRFQRKTNRRGPKCIRLGTRCWLWLGSCDKDGYGKCYHRHKHERAHRIAWKMWRGKIPKDMKICHKCDNPPCVRPSHLFLGDALSNMLDKMRKGRWRGGGPGNVGTTNGRAKLSEHAVRYIRYLGGFDFGPTYIAERMDMSKSTISSILLGRSWQSLLKSERTKELRYDSTGVLESDMDRKPMKAKKQTLKQAKAQFRKEQPNLCVNGWDERDYRLWSQLNGLPSYGLVAGDKENPMLARKDVIRLLQQNAEARFKADWRLGVNSNG